MDYIQLLIAIATISAVVVALFKDEIYNFLSPLKVKIEPLPPSVIKFKNGQPNHFDEICYWNMKIINVRNTRIIENCTVNLIKLEKYTAYGFYENIPYSTIRQFEFSPADHNDISRSFNNYTVSDFIKLKKGDKNMYLCLRNTNLLDYGYIEPNTKYKLTIELFAKNLNYHNTFVVKLFWDGSWVDKWKTEVAIKDQLDIRVFPI